MTEIIFKVLLLIMIHFGFMAKEDNVETAFLYGELEDEIYMKCPPRMKEVRKDECISLGK